MSAHHRNPPAILGAFVLLLCLGTDLAAQSPYAPLTAGDSVQQQPQSLIRKFTFKHAKAADVLKILQQLAGPTDHIGLKIAVDERTNSFVFQPDDDRQARELEETCVLLDTETPSPSVTGNGISISVPALGPTPQQKSQVFSFSMGFERSESIETLKQRYKQLEQQAHQLADKLNQSTSLSDSQRTELQLAVRKSFEARQALQRAELADLAQRMKSMQQSIDMRDKLADKVVERRVEDLLNPNLKWDLTEPAAIAQRESSSKPKSIKEAVSAILLRAKSDSVPYKLAAVGILYEGKAEVGDFKDEIFEQVEAEARTFAHFQLISRRVADAAMADSKLRLKDLFVAENTRSLFPVMTKFGQSMDFLLLLRLEEVDVSRGESEGNFRLTLRLVDKTGQTLTEQIDVSKGKRADDSKQSTNQSTTGYASPQELLDAVEQHGKSGSYEDFVTLFNDEGVRDLAGSLLMSALQLTGSVDLAKTQGAEASSGMDSGVSAVSEVLKRWLPQSANAEQLKAMHDGLSTMWSAIGGASENPSALKAFRISMRKSVEGITDHRKFCVEIMQAYEKLTTKPFVYFGNGDQKSDWQGTQFGDRATATLIDGSPGMATTITLQQASGTWRISSLFNELNVETQPATKSPTSSASIPSNAKTVTRRYSVGSFVTESFFAGKGSYDTKEVYDKYETEISQSLEDLAKTVTAACTQPPKFVQVLRNSRCLLIGHTEAGHQEIVDFMRDIGINNDRIRLRGVAFEITKDQAKTLGIEVSQRILKQVLSTEQVEKLRAFSKSRPSALENRNTVVSFAAMDETLVSGTQKPLKVVGDLPIPLTIAARIVPGSRQIQIRMDMHDLGNVEIQYVAPQFQTLNDGQSVVFQTVENLYWLATTDIVRESTGAVFEDALPSNHDAKGDLQAGLETIDHAGLKAALKQTLEESASANPSKDSTATTPEKRTPVTPAMEMQQRLQGEWDVKVMGVSADLSDKRPYQAVVRGQLFLLQCMEDGKVIGTSPWKMIWPEADHPDVVDIVWDPNNNSDEYCAPGRITCDGKSFQVAWRSDDSISGPAIRPTETCSGEGISYFECVRKQPADQSPTSTSSDAPVGPKYSGHPLSWWLDSYWDNATAIPKTAENAAQEFVASEAIRKLREKPECEAVIEAAFAKWFASVEHEVNEGQLTRAAKCIVTIAGPVHQETAVNLLFKIWKRMPLLTYEEQGEMADDATELNQLLSQLVLNDRLAAQLAERLTNGDSSDRSLVLYGFLSLMGRFGVETNNDLTELENWLRQNAKRLAPAVEAASHDVNEKIRFTSLIQLATLIHATKLDPELVRLPKILLTAASDASPNVRYIAIELLTSNELASSFKSQNIELSPILIKTFESDTSIDVRYSALGALMKLDAASEVVHATLLEWARCKERLQVEYALSLMLRNHAAGDRPHSIDELIELLSDPEWGNTVEVKQSNWSTYHHWARQYAIAILGQYAAHAHRAIPTLEAELARNNKDTLSFATVALDNVRGYCPDLPIDKLQGEWEFVSLQKPEGSSPFFDFHTSSDQQPSSLVMISGTQLKLGDRVLAELSHYRSGSRQGVTLLLDPDGKKRHCHGGYNFKGGPSPEYKPNAAQAPELLILEVSELLNNWDATQATKQIYEFRPVKK